MLIYKAGHMCCIIEPSMWERSGVQPHWQFVYLWFQTSGIVHRSREISSNNLSSMKRLENLLTFSVLWATYFTMTYKSSVLIDGIGNKITRNPQYRDGWLRNTGSWQKVPGFSLLSFHHGPFPLPPRLNLIQNCHLDLNLPTNDFPIFCKISFSGRPNCYVFGIIGRLFKNDRVWW